MFIKDKKFKGEKKRKNRCQIFSVMALYKILPNFKWPKDFLVI